LIGVKIIARINEATYDVIAPIRVLIISFSELNAKLVELVVKQNVIYEAAAAPLLVRVINGIRQSNS
jgi:hypothetical protein